MGEWRDLGGYAVKTLVVSRFRLDGGSMFGQVPKALWSRHALADEQNRIPLVLRALLLRRGEALWLIDPGMGSAYSAEEAARLAVEPGGGLASALAVAGVDAERVTDILLTHLHFDHAGGLGERGPDGRLRPALPGARVHLHRTQWERAHAPGPKELRSYRPIDLELLREIGPRLIDGSAELLPGLEARPTDGHTPGLLLVTVRGTKESLVYPSDLIPTLAHIRAPYTTGFDMWPERLMAEKEEILSGAADSGAILVLNHDPRTAACRVRRAPSGFVVSAKVEL